MNNLDWGSLSFGYMKTDYNVRCYYRDGKWGEIEVCSDEYLNLHMAATCLHYGQEAFEGLKAYRCPDGKVRIFRVDENAARLQSTCRGIMMPEVSTELFTEMVKKVVRLNQEWIPTYESGATLYIRPLLIGTSAQVGVHPAKEYCFLIFVTPVGPYFKGGFAANPYVIIRDYDRSAPLGTGKYKVGGNYAASLFANNLAHEKGYACEFYLDAKEKKYMDECGAANFFGIKNNTYITPKSSSILPSITNKSLMQVAEDLGMKVERRPIPEEELETFEEAGACGTAAVISPISYIDDLDTGKRYSFGEKPGPMSKKLFDTLRGIQYGEIEDKHGWTTVVIEYHYESITATWLSRGHQTGLQSHSGFQGPQPPLRVLVVDADCDDCQLDIHLFHQRSPDWRHHRHHRHVLRSGCYCASSAGCRQECRVGVHQLCVRHCDVYHGCHISHHEQTDG